MKTEARREVWYFARCEDCGARGPEAHTLNQAVSRAKVAGWMEVTLVGMAIPTTLCPTCLRKVRQCHEEE